MDLPQPNFAIAIPRQPNDPGQSLTALPTSRGVFAFVDADGAPLCLAVTANLRRLVRSRLEPITGDEPTRRVDYNQLTRCVRALPVGSSFEADWAFLQFARRLAPSAVAAMTDRWRGWWVHVNPLAAFPRLIKTARPGSGPTGATGVHLGPIADKHDAARFIETLQGGFDLCRYHHILIEAPHGRACAYKEMGRCPAPCDGTVSMAHYHQQVADAVAFACDRDRWMQQLEQTMASHSESLEFESADRIRRQIDDLAVAMKPAFAHVDRLDNFRWVALCPSEHPDRCRVFVINGGWMAPIADVPFDASSDDCIDVAGSIADCLAAHTISFDDRELQNLGLACAYLLRPKKKARSAPMVFIRCLGSIEPRALRTSIQKLQRQMQRNLSPTDDTTTIGELVIDVD